MCERGLSRRVALEGGQEEPALIPQAARQEEVVALHGVESD
jgi:hypothetical protein